MALSASACPGHDDGRSWPVIVHARPPKRQRRLKAPQPALTAAIVTTRKRGSRPPADLPDDAEADARVKAWFAKNVRPLGT
jgi:hypothetical protein